MRPDQPKGIWENGDNLFDFNGFDDWRDGVSDFFRDAGRSGDGPDIGAMISDLATHVGLGDDDLGTMDTADQSADEPNYAPSWKTSGSGGGGKGGGNGHGKGGTTTTTGDGSTTTTTDSSTTTTTDSSTTTTTDGSTTTTTDSGPFVSDAPQYVIDAVSTPYEWSNSTITYNFMSSLPSYWSDTSKPGFTAFDADQIQATLQVLGNLSQFANVTFVESSIGASNLAFGNAQLGSGVGGYAYYPGGTATGTAAGDVWINNQYSSQLNPVEGNYAYLTLIHEIGHAMGLSHPFDGSVTLPASEDTRQYTVMSYNADSTMSGVEPQTYMLYDIAALQTKYGANMSYASGDNVYDFASASNLLETIWDAGGTDTFDASGRSDGVVFNLNAGTFSSVGTRGSALADQNVAIAYNVTIENAIGSSGNDTITGNDANNVIVGGGGTDYLVGGGGNDLFAFDGAWGADTIADFQDGVDHLDFSGSGLAFGDFQFAGDASGASVSYGDNSITLSGLDIASLDQNDFLFS